MIKYKVRSRGNDSVACQVGPLSGPLNQFGNRTLENLREGDLIYKASEVDALLTKATMKLNGLCAQEHTRLAGQVFLSAHALSVIQDVLHNLYQLEENA